MNQNYKSIRWHACGVHKNLGTMALPTRGPKVYKRTLDSLMSIVHCLEVGQQENRNEFEYTDAAI